MSVPATPDPPKELTPHEKALAYFSRNKAVRGYGSSWFYENDKALALSSWMVPCYSGLTPRLSHQNPLVLMVGHPIPKADEGVYLRWFNWVTDPDVSPWRKIIGDNKLILHKNIFDEYICCEIPLDILKRCNEGKFSRQVVLNLLSALRTTNEFHANMLFWDHAVQKGYNPVDAFVVCCLFQLRDSQIVRQTIGNCNHWPLHYWGVKGVLSFKKLDEGDFDPNPNSCDSVFTSRTKEYSYDTGGGYLKTLFTGIGKETATKFSRIHEYPLDEIMKKVSEYRNEA